MTDLEFEKLIIRLKDKLYRLAFSILRQKEDAQDAVQEVVLKLWKNRYSLNRANNFESYCMSSVKNHSLDLLRRQKQHVDYKESAIIKNRTVKINDFDNRDLIEKIFIQVQQLPDQQRMAIELKDFQGYDYDEISDILEQSVNAIRANVSRGRKKLYEIFKEELKDA